MMHPLVNAHLAKIHQVDMLQSAEKDRKGAADRARKPGLQERLAMRIGTLLIATGQRLRAPYEPALNHQPKVYRPGC